MSRWRAFASIAVVSMALAVPQAQAAVSEERAAVLATANALLDSWREADNAKGDRVLHKDFRLTTFQGVGVTRRVHVVDRAGLLNASKDLKPGDWDDQLKDVEVRIGSNGLAVVTARYLFSAERKPTHCGMVAMQLYKDRGSWQIISFADTHNNLNGRTEAEVCPG